MLFAPDSKVLRALWFDKIWEAQQKAEVEEKQSAKMKRLSFPGQQRVQALRDQRARLLKLAAENQSLTIELMAGELSKMEHLVADFLDLAVLCEKAEQHLATFDFHAMQRSWDQYTWQVKNYPDGDQRREVAEKNLEVLTKRRARFDELRRTAQTGRGQMDLMENTFRLLADEIVTMANPAELGTRLDDLRIGVDAVRETTAAADDLYEVVDIEESVEQPKRQARR